MSSDEQKNVGMKKGPIDLIASGSGGSSIMTQKNIENAVDQISKSFNLTVTERINTQPEFRREILRQVIECISSDDLLVAKKMLDQVVEADEGVEQDYPCGCCDGSGKSDVGLCCPACGGSGKSGT